MVWLDYETMVVLNFLSIFQWVLTKQSESMKHLFCDPILKGDRKGVLEKWRKQGLWLKIEEDGEVKIEEGWNVGWWIDDEEQRSGVDWWRVKDWRVGVCIVSLCSVCVRRSEGKKKVKGARVECWLRFLFFLFFFPFRAGRRTRFFKTLNPPLPAWIS
jgi:hypothetical protein